MNQRPKPVAAKSSVTPHTDPKNEMDNQLLSKRAIQVLMAQLDPNEKLDMEVEEILLEIADDFVEKVASFGCSLAKHRKSDTLEPKDILLHLEKQWHMRVPGFLGDGNRLYDKDMTNNHRGRLNLVQKSIQESNNNNKVGGAITNNNNKARGTASTKKNARGTSKPLS